MLRRIRENRARLNKVLEETKTQAPLELEKNDLKAIIIAAFIVIFPILLVFVGVVALLYWVAIGRF